METFPAKESSFIDNKVSCDVSSLLTEHTPCEPIKTNIEDSSPELHKNESKIYILIILQLRKCMFLWKFVNGAIVRCLNTIDKIIVQYCLLSTPKNEVWLIWPF